MSKDRFGPKRDQTYPVRSKYDDALFYDESDRVWEGRLIRRIRGQFNRYRVQTVGAKGGRGFEAGWDPMAASFTV